ncbi:MAG: VWA domain-containing protein [Acidobacteriaceae bacterium]|nr:VWA domain-containing protein [Acidobacteriaceae bacterium]
MRSFCVFGSLLLAGVLAVDGQQPVASQPVAVDAGSTLSVEARLVVVPVVVRDKHGAIVKGLAQSNFALQVDGVAQNVRYFDRDSDVPLTVGLLVDSSRSQREVLEDERSASTTFLQKMLAPERDRAFVLQFAGSVELLQDITNSRPKLQEALQQVDTAPSRPTGRDSNDPDANDPDHRGGGRQRGGGTAMYDAVFLSADEVVNKQAGRKAFILLTDGVDNGSRETLAKSIEAAQRKDVVIYAIYYKGKEHDGGGRGFGFPGGGGHGMGLPGGGGGRGGGWPGGGGGGGRNGGGDHHENVDGRKILERLCGETGGRVFEVTKKETVEKIYAEIGEELRSQFRLGFTPSEATASEGYHQISVTLAGSAAKEKDTIQTRDGYYTKVAKQGVDR